jgi:hypothetical protein
LRRKVKYYQRILSTYHFSNKFFIFFFTNKSEGLKRGKTERERGGREEGLKRERGRKRGRAEKRKKEGREEGLKRERGRKRGRAEKRKRE